MSAMMAPALAKSRAARAGSMAVYPRFLPSPQEFRIDRADLVERCAQLAKIVDQSGNLQMSVVGHVVSSRSPAGLADGQIPLRAVSRSIDAVAVRSTAALVSLDQCAAQHLFDRWQIAHKSATASAQGRCGKVLDHHRTESRILSDRIRRRFIGQLQLWSRRDKQSGRQARPERRRR